MEESIAVTQNVVNSANLFNVTHFLKSKKKQEVFDEFTKQMKEKHQQEIEVALQKVAEMEKPKKKTLWERLTSDTGSGFSLFGDSGLLDE